MREIFYLSFIALSLSVFLEIDVAEASPTPEAEENADNSQEVIDEAIVTNIVSVLSATIGAIVTILIAFWQYKKGKEAQAIEHQNSLEYEYAIDLRKRRLEAYVDLWKLTHIEFTELSHSTEISYHKSRLSDWYYDDGHGMLLTEPSQKLFYNFKQHLEELSKNWDNLTEPQRIDEIGKTKDQIASGLRSSLLKDVGTRSELKNLPSYNQLIMKEPEVKEETEIKEGGRHIQHLKVSYAFFGSQILKLEDKKVLLQITNLDKNEPVGVATKELERLEPGKWDYIEWRNPDGEKLLEDGKYSARVIVSGTIMSEKPFNYLNVKIDDINSS